MSKKRLFRLVVLMAAMMCALGANAKEAYACYTSENKTFTFYYDDERSTRPGNSFLLQEEPGHLPLWSLSLLPATKAVFDRSFANYRPTTTHGWFYYMQNLQSITGIRYLNTSDVTDMGEMFANCTQLTSLDLNGLNTSKVTNMSRMFDGCTALTSLNLNGLNTSNVTDMGNMFDGCTSLQTIIVGERWNTDAVTYSKDMFHNTTSLVGGMGTVYNESNPTDKTYAHADGGSSNPGYFTASGTVAYVCYTPENTTLSFYYDDKIGSRPGGIYTIEGHEPGIPMWHWDYPYVTNAVIDPSFADYRPTSTNGWFYDMPYLKSITGIQYLNTIEVTDMSEMFTGCGSLPSIDLSGFNTANVERMYGMFENCHSLTRLDLSTFNTAKVNQMTRMFANCEHLQTIYVGDEWSNASLLYSGRMFAGCNSLVGGQGTTYDEGHVDGVYAHIDGGPSNPGYFSKRPTYTRGDVNDDLDVNIADVTALIDYLLNGDASVINPDAADCNLDASINISDVTVLIDYLLSGSWPEPVYTVVGTPNLFESEWDLNDERNNMIKGADGIYRLNKAGWFPEGTEIYFRIVTNHSYAFSWPAEERLIYIYETGAFSIDIIFDPNAPDDQKINIDMNKIF